MKELLLAITLVIVVKVISSAKSDNHTYAYKMSEKNSTYVVKK